MHLSTGALTLERRADKECPTSMVKAIPGSHAKCRQLLGVRDPDHFLPSLPRFATISTERLILWQYQSSGPISSIYPRIKRDSWGRRIS
jgi:hypothetical protein